MDARTKLILETGIRDYIKTGEPITSERLYRFYDFGIKPAMIRWELNDLSGAGYLMQVHTSGGRVPTNKAYRFFVQELLSKESAHERIPEQFDKLARNFLEGDIDSFVKCISEEFGLLGIGYEPEEDNFWESGLEGLLEKLDVETKPDLLDVVKDFESLPERLLHERSWLEKGDFWPQIFIGSNPMTKSDYLSVLAGRFDFNGEDMILMAIGPKRMDYQKPIRLFRYLNKVKR